MRVGHAAAVLVVTLAAATRPARAQQEHLSRPGALEGRPATVASSPLQAVVDRAPAGSRVEVPPGSYIGDLVIDKPLTLAGRGRPRLVGSGTGSVVRVRADDVTLEGFDIDGRGTGDLGRDTSGVHVFASRATIRDCRIVDSLFGVYLREAHGSRVEGCTIRGIPGLEPGEKGSGIHAYNTERFHLIGNELADVRDALYLQNSSHGIIRGNVARDMRYGLHYMFSDDNTFEENTFERGDAGTAVMYSRRIIFRRNRFIHNRGFASVGLLLQQCDDVLAEDNFIGDNARGIFLEGTERNVFRRNVVAESDTAIVLYASARSTRFQGNLFIGNLSPLMLVGKRTDTNFDGNYWSDNHEPDLDGDGRSDRPHRLASVFDHFRGNLTAADLFTDSVAALALGAAEQALPIIEAPGAFDRAAVVHPPTLEAVPVPSRTRPGPYAPAVALSAVAFCAGVSVLVRGRRPRAPRWSAGA